MAAMFVSALAVALRPVKGHSGILVAPLQQSSMTSTLQRWTLEEEFLGEMQHARAFRGMSQWPLYRSAYEQRQCIGLFRAKDRETPVCIVQMEKHLSSLFFVQGLAIPESEIATAPELMSALSTLGMSAVAIDACLHFVFERDRFSG